MSRRSARDLVVQQLAAVQHGVVARHQLLQHDLPPDFIDRWVESGRLLRIRRGVYAVGHDQLRPRGHWLAAVLSVGPAAALSHGHAAANWDLDAAPGGPVRVLLPGRAGRVRRRGVRIYRPTLFDPADVTVHEGIPTTTIGRTLLDLAARTPVRELEQMVRSASRQQLFDLNELTAVIDRHQRHRGARTAIHLVAQMKGRGTEDLRSKLEARLLQICDDYGLPRPVVNGHVEGERVDFFWSRGRLVVETDGFTWHSTPSTFAADRRRDQRLVLAGYRVVRFTWEQVRNEPHVVAETLVALLTGPRAA